eukprot:151630-Hanusia_phi.AAC.1
MVALLRPIHLLCARRGNLPLHLPRLSAGSRRGRNFSSRAVEMKLREEGGGGPGGRDHHCGVDLCLLRLERLLQRRREYPAIRDFDWRSCEIGGRRSNPWGGSKSSGQ